jgi:hypothetical protein
LALHAQVHGELDEYVVELGYAQRLQRLVEKCQVTLGQQKQEMQANDDGSVRRRGKDVAEIVVEWEKGGVVGEIFGQVLLSQRSEDAELEYRSCPLA